MSTWRLLRLAGAGAAALPFCGCTGGLHHKGQQQFTVLGSYDHSIKGEVIWPDGDGRGDNAGVALGYNYFTADRFSVGAALTPYRNYNQSDGDAYAGEFQIALRYYFAEFDVAETPVGLYAELTGGLMQSGPSVPEDGTHTNFTQDSGLGFEVKLSDNVSWISGYRLRHESNGYVFGQDNPSQNDHQVYTGIAISW